MAPLGAQIALAAGGSEGLEMGGAVNALLAPLLAQAEEACIKALGAEKFASEFASGTEMTRERAAALALGESRQQAAPSQGSVDALAKRERDVAALVAEGMSNKQIGARLFISERTVETHVRSILNKLGFNSRAQIASWVASSR